MHITKPVFLYILITLIPWFIYLMPWQMTLVTMTPWAPWVTVLATALSPLIAVQVTRALDSRTEKHKERMGIFQNLMAYRKAESESLEFCKAISLVDVVFSSSAKDDSQVLDSLNNYKMEVMKIIPLTSEQISVMTSPEQKAFVDINIQQTESRREALNNLLYAMSQSLGMNISHQSISTNGFWPAWVGLQITASREGAQANINSEKHVREILELTRNSPSSTPSTSVPDVNEGNPQAGRGL